MQLMNKINGIWQQEICVIKWKDKKEVLNPLVANKQKYGKKLVL